MNKSSYLLLWLGLIGSCSPPSIQIIDNQVSEGQECYKIVTQSAVYWYQKEAGGFSNIFDNLGTDWVQFHKSAEAKFPASAASDYRGLPNLVFRSPDGGCGHPGFDKMTSEIIDYNQIRSVSNSGKWQWKWIFHENYAELEIEKTDPEHTYWFLYEGPIAGNFSPATHYWGTDLAGPLNQRPDLIKGPELYEHWQTVYFGDRNYQQVFFVHQVQPDSLRDLYTYMGNDQDLGNDSPDGMVVFGFGRDQGAQPLMQGLQKFRIGFFPAKVNNKAEHQHLISTITSLN